MPTIDFRTRFEGDEVDLDLTTFLDRNGEAIEANASTAATALATLALPALTLEVDGEPLRFAPEGERLVVGRDAGDELLVTLDRAAFSDLVQGVASTFGVQMTGRATVTRGEVDQLIRWEPVLRCLLDGRPSYEPGAVTFQHADGAPLDPQQSFRVDDDPAEIGHFLSEVGYLHLEEMFTADEMAAVAADHDRAIAEAEQDDGASWWARTKSGEWYPSRILGFNQKSPALREVLASERFARIGTFTDDPMIQRDPDDGDSAEGLLKKIDVVEGISDVSWHKDCSMGGHSRHCCGLVVGISVTGAGPTNGELGVVPGSHRANVSPLGADDVDLPRLPLPTRTGDVTVHCSCTLHMSRPPVSAERRVVYTGFGLAPRAGDRRIELDEATARRDRAALNDHVRRGQHDDTAPARTAGFDL